MTWISISFWSIFTKKEGTFLYKKWLKKIKNQLFLKSFKIILLTIALMDLEKTIISSEFRPYFHEFHAVWLHRNFWVCYCSSFMLCVEVTMWANSWVRVDFWVPRCWFSETSWKMQHFSYLWFCHTTRQKKVILVWKFQVLLQKSALFLLWIFPEISAQPSE